MPETITRAGEGFLGRVIDSKNDGAPKTDFGYRNALGLGFDDGANGEMTPHVIASTGNLRQANFTGAGIYANAPVLSVIIHAGTRNAALTACALMAIRQVDSADTIADWFSGDGVALSTLVTD